MSERKGAVTMKGKALTLVGDELKVGYEAPEFTAINNDLSEYKFPDEEGKIYIISSVPSLDTPVCDSETRKFNDKAANLSNDVKIITISADLPFAQSRWCGVAGVDRIKTVSDHRDMSFGKAYGVMIKELRLLARAVFVIDRERIIRHIEIVHEVGDEPHYDDIIEEAKKLL
jgi:thioredoxin-dependent peroxiredoxin